MPMETGTDSVVADALVESFDDRRSIDISRKTTACIACRKQKIKCLMPRHVPPCTRCKKKGLPCHINPSLQMILDGDAVWKTRVEEKLESLMVVEQKLRNLEHSLQLLQRTTEREACRQDGSLHAQNASILTGSTNIADQCRILQQDWQAPPDENAPSNIEIVMDLNQGPGVIPASVVSQAPSTHSPNAPDLVEGGIISLEQANALFDLYYTRLDNFLYVILPEHSSLESIRKSSPLLTAAVCTVASLHDPSSQYEALNQYFIHLASSSMFSKKNSWDDIRAFCIGAFWLSDKSWTLVGTAARLAGELNLHRCIPKAPHTKKDCYLRTRMYYQVFVCDHHFSIVYGRPPLTRDFSSITAPTDFLKSEFATEDDVGLISQVELWTILTRVFDQFTLDPNASLSDRLIPQMRRLNIALDTWRADWTERFGVNNGLGGYCRRGIGLYYHFAKLFLCSHVFRLASVAKGKQPQLDSEFAEFATLAVHSAVSILQVITTDTEIQSDFSGFTAYFDTMIAFAFVFLLKMTLKDPMNVLVDKIGITKLLDRLVDVLVERRGKVHSRHLLGSIASNMRELLDRILHNNSHCEGNEQDRGTSARLNASEAPVTGTQSLSPTDAMILENYDFLYSSGGDFDFDFGFNGTQSTYMSDLH